MKYILLVLGLTMSVHATEYRCIDKNKLQATLVIDAAGRSIKWFQARAKPTSGVYKGVEKAPYSEWKGYYQYQLEQWSYTNDSSWILAIDLKSSAFPRAVVYYDNDDHPENENFFQCYR